jgi:YbgC/YbaW family acyl-CoA thioester hydrolase
MSPPPITETSEEVMFFDTDAGGVVHNIAYLRFIESNRTRLGSRIGLDVRAMAAQQQFAAVVRTEIDYRRPALLADQLTIRGWLDSFERATFWCAFEIIRPSDQALLVSCRQQLALVELPKGKPIRLPADWKSRWPHLGTSRPPA